MSGTGTARNVAAGDNNTFPGAVMPFGMMQWSPDSEDGKHRGGYWDQDKRISDVSLDHLTGTGCHYGADFAFMAFPGDQPTAPPASRTTYATTYSHTNEVAKPGYYGVKFDNGVKIELTATTRTGFGRFTYPAEGAATMMINAGNDAMGASASSITLNPATREMSGWSIGGRFCGSGEVRQIYFYGVFDAPFKAWSTWSDKVLTAGATNGGGVASGAFITFDAGSGRTVLAKVGMSYVSVANAKANLEAEASVSALTAQDFDQAVQSASDVWNQWLNKIQVSGGTRDEKVTFYSMLYHALIGPVTVSDANGEYIGYDGQVHTTEAGRTQYGVFSGWDVYRSQCQLLGMIAPKEASDMAQSLLVDYQQGGAFPRWGVMTTDSGVMMGDPAAAMIADYYAFGATNFDTDAALKGLVRAATDPSVYAPRSKTRERDALDDYLKLGYVPEHQTGGYGCVSMTLEFVSADFALSQFAQALGDSSDAEMLLQHAQNWKHHFNPASGYLEMRRRDGSWAPGFTNNVSRYDKYQAYVEGTAGQYLWMVPFNLRALADMMGGNDVAAKRLDASLVQLNSGDQGPNSWMSWVGNEPDLNMPWIYDFLGQPWKTQATVRRAMTELYGPGDDAYPGNDDVGEMSSWYVFGALGMYPELPGSDILVLGSPMFSKAVIHLPGGDATIIGKGAAANAPYVQSLKVNGEKTTKTWIRYADISHGGRIVYKLGTKPNTSWGTKSEDAPPSFD
jgi:predicted alpha-1,2-mannosidase